MAVVEIQVYMHLQGCEKKIRRVLRKLKGIHIDVAAQKVTVMRFIEQRKVLRTVGKTGIMAQPWPHQYNNVYNDFVHDYYRQPVYSQSHKNSYRLNARHSYADPQLSYSEMVMDQPISMSSDDNVNACSIM